MELGHIQIRIDRPADGPAHVVLAVERSDTLMLLLQDKPQLNQALDAAGIPPQGRTLQFDLSPGGGNAGQDNAGQNNAGHNNDRAREGPAQPQSNGADRQDAPRRPPPPATWSRTGVDITA